MVTRKVAAEELEQRVLERTSELAATNAALQAENAVRKRVEAERSHLYAQMQASHEQLQTLSRQLLQAQEAERRAIARELHDEIGQQLSGMGILLSMINPQLPFTGVGIGGRPVLRVDRLLDFEISVAAVETQLRRQMPTRHCAQNRCALNIVVC